jgi:hypothetical protein
LSIKIPVDLETLSMMLKVGIRLNSDPYRLGKYFYGYKVYPRGSVLANCLIKRKAIRYTGMRRSQKIR